MKSCAVLGVFALCFLASLLAAVPVGANEPPFGEPELVLDSQELAAGQAIWGPLPLGEIAILLANEDPSPGFPSRLWRTDGTAEGTYSIHPGDVRFDKVFSTTGKYRWLTGFGPANGVLSLWRTDGTAGGTRRLAESIRLGGAFRYHAERGLLFFSAAPWGPGDSNPRAADYEPWVSDGTASGTRRLKDILAAGSSQPGAFCELGEEVAFLAIDPDNQGFALWKSDGTADGTRLVKLPEGASFRSLQTVGSELYMVARSAGYELSLWKSDGTAEGSRQIAELGRNDGNSGYLGVAFSGDLGDGRSLWTIETEDVPGSLWITDGTPAGTQQLMTLASLSSGLYPQQPVPYQGAYYFDADDGTIGRELWRTDGTPEGTSVAFETCPGACSEFGRLSQEKDGLLVIWSSDEESGMELRATDGTAAGTELLLDLCPGSCSPDAHAWFDHEGHSIFSMRTGPGGYYQLWGTDFTPEGTQQLTDFSAGTFYDGVLGYGLVNGHHLFLGSDDGGGQGLWSLPVGPFDPPAPLGDWLSSATLPGYSFKVRISTGSGSLAGTQETSCIPETLCVSGALPGRSEVFLRVVGPKPNGRMWPTLVKFSTSTVEVWVRQDSSGEIRYYRLEGARPGYDELPGLFDRDGFAPGSGAASELSAFPGLTLAEPRVLAGSEAPPPPGTVFTSEHFPDFRFQARISAGGQVQEVRQEAACIEETLCLSGALPGRSEVFVRIVGPKPNGRLWPTVVKFTTSTVEVWVEQVSTGDEKYYRIEGAAPGKDDLTGLFDRDGFAP